MATKPKKSLPSPKCEDAVTPEVLREQVSRLQGDLESERKLVKLLRREKSYEVQHTRELEQTKATVALKDLRTKLHLEKSKEIETIKESLNRKSDSDLQMVSRQKEAELTKLRMDLRKCQDELQQTREQNKNFKRGLSGLSARGAFDSERSKLLQENQELRTARKHLEDGMKTITDAEKHKTHELAKCQEALKVEVAKSRKDADVEIRRLLEELKAKDRLVWQMEKEQGARTGYSAATHRLLQAQPAEMLSCSTQTETSCQCQLTDDTSGVRKQTEYIATETGSPPDTEPGGAPQQQVAELSALVKELQEQCSSLTQDKNNLQNKLQEMEKRNKSTLEKNKQFLEKNIEVTNINRCLEEKIKKLHNESDKLKSQSEKCKKDQEKLSEQLSSEKGEKANLDALRQELEDHRQQTEEQEKSLAALKMACLEKDRRIDLLIHKRRKQKNRIQQKMVRFLLPAKCQAAAVQGANGIKETYFGYDEDTLSLDSEMSSAASCVSSGLSLDTSAEEDDVFEEQGRSDLEQNFQRLMKEHLELERSHALLQAKIGRQDPEQDSKDCSWLEEKDTLTKTVRMLKEKVKSQEQHEARVTFRIREAQEQNEELEFRILELEETITKLKDEAKDTITIKEPPTLTDTGILQMYAEEKGLMEVKLETIKEKLHDLKYSKDGFMQKSDKLVLLQARAMLGIAEKKLKDLTTAKDVLREKVKKLEEEKAELLSAATGVSPDLILEHEQTRQKLAEAEQRIQELEKAAEEHHKVEAVHKYTEDHNAKLEAQHRKEIASLQRQLRNSAEGRDYESELWQENQDRIRELERDTAELQGRISTLCQNISKLEIENTQLLQEKSELEDKLRHLEKPQGTTETDSESDTITEEDLKSKLGEAKDEIGKLTEKSTSLESEKSQLMKDLQEAKVTKTKMEGHYSNLEAELSSSTDMNKQLETEVNTLKTNLTDRDNIIKQAESQLHLLSEQSEKKTKELNELNEQLSLQVAELQQKVQDVQILAEEHKTCADDLKVRVHDLEELKNSLSNNNLTLKNDLEKSCKAQKDAENQVTQLNNQNKTLIEKVKALEVKVKESRDNEVKTRDTLVLMEEEKSRRIQALQEQVDKMEENEHRLSETISEMEEVEEALRNQLRTANSSLESPLHTRDSEEDESFRESQQNLMDKIEQMEENERLLRERIVQLEDGHSAQPGDDQIKDLEDKVKELTAKESQLLEEVYSMKLENQELQEHLDELLDEKENADDSFQSEAQVKDEINLEEMENLRKDIAELEKEKVELKDQLLKAKLSVMETMKETDEYKVREKVAVQALQDRVNDLEESEDKLKKDMEEKETTNKYLKEKVRALEVTEEKLTEQINFLEEDQHKLNEEIRRLREASSAATSPGTSQDQELLSRVKELEIREGDLKDTIQDMETASSSMKDKLNQYQSQHSQEVKQLREKVEILLDTEEKLVDRLQQQQEVEEALKKKLDVEVKKFEEVKSQLEIYKAKCEQLKDQLETEKDEITESDNKEEVDLLVEQVQELENKERVLKVKVSDLERSETVLRTKLSALEETSKQKELTEKDLRNQLLASSELVSDLKARLGELEKNDVALRTKLSGLETQKQDLLETIRASAQKSQAMNHDLPDTHPAVEQSGDKPADGDVSAEPDANTQASNPLQNIKMNSSFIIEKPTDIEELTNMPKEEMISRIHELEQMEQFHMVKIKELSENLSTFRQAVEVVAVTMETDSDIPLLNYRPKLRDQEFEARVQELVKSEVTLKLRNLELEKKEAILRSQLNEAESTLKRQKRDFTSELEDLEAELDHVRKSEAMLKNKLQYGNWGQENQALAKIQHLENLVFDLETSERKLKRRLQESLDAEADMKEKVSRMEQLMLSNPVIEKIKSLQKEDKYYDLLAKVTLMEGTEQALKDKLSKDSITSDLQQRIRDLESSEHGLKRKLTQLEAQEARMNYEEDQSPMVLDSPEAILRQRIRELEKMERHLKQQVIELEKDREELHEIARNDKSVIHDLNVRVRELQLSEKNLKEQVALLEATESQLHMKLDDMTDQIEELQDIAKKLQTSEKHLKAQLQKSEYQESALGTQLENAREDVQKLENRLKKKSSEMEADRVSILRRRDDMADRIGDLEGVEMTLKQKVRNLENAEVTLKSKISELETAEKSAKSRSMELETINETLSQKIHSLEEEKSSLIFEMSDMEILRSEHKDEVSDLQRSIRSLKDSVKDHEEKKAALQQRLDEFTDHEVALQARLMEYESREKELRDMIQRLGQDKEKLQDSVQDLQADVSVTEARLTSSGRLERENTFLQGQVEHHAQNMTKLQDNSRELEEKLRFYENSATQGNMATLPKSELSQLRDQVALVDKMHQDIAKLEKSEKNLMETVKSLRQGKNSCGHEIEISEFKKQTEQNNSKFQAHELLKHNYEEMKKEHKLLQDQILKGDLKVKNNVSTLSKSIQVRLTDSYTIRHLAPADLFYHLENKEEFKNALKNLGARHPEAYQDFVRALQPPEGKQLSIARVTEREASPPAPPRGSSTPKTSTQATVVKVPAKMSDSGINEDFILAHSQEGGETNESAPNTGTATVQGDDKSDIKTTDGATKTLLINQLVDTLPQDKTTEDPLWQVVEDKDPGLQEKPFWAEVEGGSRDDMTLTVDVWGITTDDSGSDISAAPYPVKQTLHNQSISSIEESDMSAPPPPLPSSLPPTLLRHRSESPSNDSFYLPSSHQENDSADEASEIEDEDDGATYLKVNGVRAKSLERDSDFSEGSYRPSSGSLRFRRHGKSLRTIGSLESIPDSGTGSLRQDEMLRVMKERIVSLETQLKDQSREQDVHFENKDILASKSHSPITDTNESSRLKSLLESKEKELNLKTKEIERLTTELHRWQNNALTLQAHNTTNTDIKSPAKSDTNFDKTYSQIQQSYRNMQTENSALKKKLEGLENASEERTSLQKIVVTLKEQLKDVERIELERRALETKLKALEEELRKKAQVESELTQENAKIKHEVDLLKQANNQYKMMERDYSKVKSKYNEMEQIKSKALTMVTPLRAKVIRLASNCKSKDDLIGRLAAELRRVGEHSQSLEEADKAATHAASEEYHRPISPLTTHTLQAFEKELNSSEVVPLKLASTKTKPSQIPRRIRNSSGDSSNSDNDTGNNTSWSNELTRSSDPTRQDRVTTLPPGGSHTSDDLMDLVPDGKVTIDDFVVSPPQLSKRPVTQLNRQNFLNGREKSRTIARVGPGLECDTFRAIKKYDPKYFSTSGHQNLELSLKEGDIVKILGPQDSHGYHEAEVDGRMGLVPALYLQPLKPTPSHNTRNINRNTRQVTSSHTDSSPEQILSLHQQLQQSHQPNISVPSNGYLNSQSDPPEPASSMRGHISLNHPAFTKSPLPSSSTRSTRGGSHPAYHPTSQTPQPASNGLQSNFCPPDPPTNFCIQRVVGDHSLLLSWTPPAMDELARSNGIVVKGYKIYINGRDKQTIASPHMTKALLEKLDLRRALTLSIQTAAENGLLSRLVEAIYEESSDRPGHHSNQDGDASSLFSSSHGDEGEKKVFLAVYDYNPDKQSPNVETSEELAFKAGDIIVTSGAVRDDGFYHGKIHGKRGLVPTNFIEEIAILRPQSRRSTSSNGSLASNLYSSGSSVISHASTVTLDRSLDRSRPPSSQSGQSFRSSQSSRMPLGTV